MSDTHHKGAPVVGTGKKKGHKGGKSGKRRDESPSRKRYTSEIRRAKNKVRRVLRHGGEVAARAYAAANSIAAYVDEVIRHAR